LELVGPEGRKARPEERFLYLTLMILVLGLYFSMHPAISFCSRQHHRRKGEKNIGSITCHSC